MADKEATLLIRIKDAGSEVLDKLSTGFKAVGVVATAAFAAISAAVAKGVSDYHDHEKAVSKLNQTLVNQGIYSKELTQSYQNLADAIRKKSTFSDEEVISATATLQSYAGQTKVTDKLIQATVDLAAAKGIDLKTASEQVGKTIGTTTNALQRQGVQMELTGGVASRMATVTQTLTQRFQGQAEEATKGLGVLGKLKSTLAEISEEIGKAAAPVVILLAGALNDLSNEALRNASIWDFVADAIKNTAKVFVVLVEMAREAANEVVTFGKIVAQVLNFKDLLSSPADYWSKVKAIWAEGSANLVKIRAQTDSQLASIDKAYSDRKNLEAKEDAERANASAANAIAAKQAAMEQEKALQAEHQAALMEAERANYELAKAEEEARWAVKSQDELARMAVHNDMKYQQDVALINREIALEQDMTQKIALENKKRQMLDKAYDDERRAQMTSLQQFQNMLRSQDVANAQLVFGQISTLASANNKTLASIGKAAAIANITISTAQGVAAAFALGPIMGPILAPIVIAAGAVQAAKVAGVNLAEGGIVKATAGGVPAVIGEGGKDEAVIPLDRAGGNGLGSTYIINVNGGMMGDQQSAREFAIVIDRELLKLRQSNQSQAFDSGVI